MFRCSECNHTAQCANCGSNDHGDERLNEGVHRLLQSNGGRDFLRAIGRMPDYPRNEASIVGIALLACNLALDHRPNVGKKDPTR